ncbi:MAG: diaminopimelate epimerase [Bacteroidales bacterium]|nr:diaminopimelate epimerase [Bacteroidales bacterium]MDD2323309.1 diaminopimelate epimerase [Bacteroidales bacterium]MDD3011035.1 diaminopimelate epimerase [Bacteroidales bacterium]MDD3961448.1 diaminopimelate epimerase [Bacteroidales bacterium]MDY0285878.1 diaminopimelate epimerase [Bacteroidales bacterium]
MAHDKSRVLLFKKFHGAGNDFILINGMENRISLSTEEIAALCHRRTGIGADGMILIRPAEDADYRMHYYNSDGREASMCGNGGRCAAAFAYNCELAGTEQRFIGPDGTHLAKILGVEQESYRVQLELREVSELVKGPGYYLLDTGSPHYVSFGHNLNTMDIVSQARKIRFSSQFAPEGLNINFAEEKNGKLFVRTYERGVEEETLSCGTGVTAAALAYAEKMQLTQGVVSILTRGGDLQVSFIKEEGHYRKIQLIGPAIQVFEGSITR